MSSESNRETAPAVEEATEAAASALTALSIGGNGGDTEELPSLALEIPARFTKSGRKKAVPFPVKLMKVLSEPRFSEVIAWTPSGKSFTILDPKVFVTDILPEYFKSAKYSSFTRKLHRWGFMRHYRGEEAGSFYHKDFMKGRLDLVEKMTCKPEVSQNKSQTAIAAAAAAVSHQKKPAQASRLPVPVPAMQMSVQMSRSHLPLQMPLHPPAGVVANSLDMAIEAEVSRRLKERIQQERLQQERLQQAALSRMFLQQQLNSPAIPLALRMQLLEMQQKKLNSIGGPLVPLTGSHNPQTKTAGEGLGQLPKSNVQGAKTA